ncbi:MULTISPECIES: hypothetical protein [Paenibacillus]|uniref:Copper amine oxidase-like N-terminal domain-containing protein n=1 Tax=Paenibacillus campinasensis TaxID=66347 RepID=A0A268EMT8_9BACL|nr:MULTISPECIES: hypothetical protein [Paenibacillus]MUG66974.1 hypothetical protein [Paenibacillus campinasensis]PAD74437.1 hypothetical protein CHH67_17975 [Paenibacillus campinasensis]PAK50835.1 hypothetical protein CHH75_16520 [Paenibacillus sp. 7541]
MRTIVLLLMTMLLSTGGEADAPVVSSAGIPDNDAAYTASPFRLLNDREVVQDEPMSLNGVDLNDTKTEIVHKLGAPAAIKDDPIQHVTVLHYDHMEIGIDHDRTEYVHVKPSAGEFQLNGQPVPMTIRDIHAFLGQPDHAAEDGDVYVRGNEALKVFMNRDSGHITGIDLFFSHIE